MRMRQIASLCGIFVAALFNLFVMTAPANAQVVPISTGSPQAIAKCQSLIGGEFAGLPGAATWITTAVHHEATGDRVAYCAIEGYVNPTVRFGMYLPSADWNGKYLVRGCGGACGQLWTEGACGKHLRDGYACLISDMGHYSTQTDYVWQRNNLQALIDFGYRATHVSSIAGKAVVEAFYDKRPSKSYFFACSTGGRQAMTEAQRFPNDFDGIIAIAPGGIGPYGGTPDFNTINLGADGEPILTTAQTNLIFRNVLKACDSNDGVRDGLVDYRDCKWQPSSIQCKPGQNDTRQCLTAAQVAVTNAFYANGLVRGGEINWGGRVSKPVPRPVQPGADSIITESLMYAANPDLRPFRDHGAKLIYAHGMNDASPARFADYYETATRTMGGLDETKKFFRFFMIPAMDHCSGGDGAWALPYLTTLEKWVEKGEAPDKIVGIHPSLASKLDYFGLDAPLLKPEQIEFTRPHFTYPLRAYYSGKGDPTKADSFVAGMKPNGKMAPEAKGPPPTPDSLGGQIASVAALTEEIYIESGIPPSNISDRITKAVRLKLYRVDAPASTIVGALDVASAQLASPMARNALKAVRVEFE